MSALIEKFRSAPGAQNTEILWAGLKGEHWFFAAMQTFHTDAKKALGQSSPYVDRRISGRNAPTAGIRRSRAVRGLTVFARSPAS